VIDKVMPEGVPIGIPGREAATFNYYPEVSMRLKTCSISLRVEGELHLSGPDVTVVRLPGGAGYMTFRPVSGSDDPAIDINLSTGRFLRFHFP
jgi:hypothetical protein